MPSIRARHQHQQARNVTSVRNGEVRPVGHGDRAPSDGTCQGSPTCTEPVMPDCPTPLCARHVRETYQFAQGVIEDRLIEAAVSIM